MRLHRAYVVRPQGIPGTRIDAVPLHDDEIPARPDIIGQGISPVPGITRVIVADLRRSLVIALSISVKEVHHRIPPGVSLSVSRLHVIGRQEDTEEPLLGLPVAKHLALMGAVKDVGCLRGRDLATFGCLRDQVTGE